MQLWITVKWCLGFVKFVMGFDSCCLFCKQRFCACPIFVIVTTLKIWHSHKPVTRNIMCQLLNDYPGNADNLTRHRNHGIIQSHLSDCSYFLPHASFA